VFIQMFRPTGKASRRLTATLATVIGLTFATSAWANDKEVKKEAGLGAVSAVTSLVYGPVKLGYALGGGLVAGMAWAASGGDAAVAKPILDASLRGDYVITPDILRGERSVQFVGRPPEQATLGEVTLEEQETWTASELEEEPTYQDDYGPWQEPEPPPPGEQTDSAWATTP